MYPSQSFWSLFDCESVSSVLCYAFSANATHASTGSDKSRDAHCGIDLVFNPQWWATKRHRNESFALRDRPRV